MSKVAISLMVYKNRYGIGIISLRLNHPRLFLPPCCAYNYHKDNLLQ
jgi:hypothetical protein